MIRNINRVGLSLINNSIKQELILKHIFNSPNRMFSSVMALNSSSALLRLFPNRLIHSQRTLTICRYCSSIVCYQFPSANAMMNNSTFLTQNPKHHSIQESQKRYKSKKPQKRPEYDSDSDEEVAEDDALSKASKPMKLRVQSLRMDGLMKKALGVARNKMETAFYEGSIRVNGTRPSKKSYQVKVGDEVDLIKGISPMNPDFLMISRVEILSVTDNPDEEDELIVKIRRTKTMYIENYESDPWKKSSSSE